MTPNLLGSLRSYLSAIISTASFHSQKGPDLGVRLCGHPIHVDKEPLEVCELRNDSIKLLVQYSRTSTSYFSKLNTYYPDPPLVAFPGSK